MFGAEHSVDTNHAQLPEIESQWAEMDPTVALVAMNAAETYTSILTKTIDGHAFNWTWAYRLKHYEVLKYVTEVNYLVNTSVATMRLEQFNKLPKYAQKALLVHLFR